MKKLLYHRTSAKAANAILKRGFKSTTTLLGGLRLKGVWLSNEPLDSNEGTKTNKALLDVLVELPTSEFAFYELVEEGKPYREWCIPVSKLRGARIRQADNRLSRF